MESQNITVKTEWEGKDFPRDPFNIRLAAAAVDRHTPAVAAILTSHHITSHPAS